jgi:regulator of protease activity HflC (stomatin/prohibitin superfamily)
MGRAAMGPHPAIRWHSARKLAALSVAPLLIGWSIAVVSTGTAAVRVNQFAGTRPGTLYPGVHWILPLIESVESYSIRDNIFTTTMEQDPKNPQPDVLRVQTKEGLTVGLAVAVRYRIDPSKLTYIHANLPQPLEEEMVAPAVSTVFRDLAPAYVVREMFSTKREEIRQAAAARITSKLGVDGIVVKEVVVRDVQLPSDYAKGLEGLLLKEQESERLTVELDVKQKMVRQAELEAQADKAREVTAAEAKAAVVVLEAKAQADAMQHTLPLKEKQIQQSRLEAEARKEATVKNAEAMAEAKVIDSKAELEKRKLMSDADEDHIRKVALADAERMKLEAAVLTQNPLLIQKIIAEKLSDKVQIMMVPNDGKFFFANDVLKGMTQTLQH